MRKIVGSVALIGVLVAANAAEGQWNVGAELGLGTSSVEAYEKKSSSSFTNYRLTIGRELKDRYFAQGYFGQSTYNKELLGDKKYMNMDLSLEKILILVKNICHLLNLESVEQVQSFLLVNQNHN